MERVAAPLPATGTLVNLPEVVLLNGDLVKPSQVKGQVLVIYWWASTCPFCALQSPEMHKLWQAQQARGLHMLALSVDKKPADAVAYLQKNGYTFPAAWVTPDIHKALPKPRGLPVTVVLGRDGRVLQAEKGQMFPEDVAQLANWL
jgi:peroxiredoxin